jgi:glycogen debranching enzyme
MDSIGRRIGRDFPFGPLADRVRDNFIPNFWNEDKDCLYDVLAKEKDASVRPNQIFAISLPFPVVDVAWGKRIVETVRRKLLTPYGLRSLAPDEAEYRGVYKGDIVERDHAYHQGTVWSWLIGPFITAYIRVGGKREEASRFLRKLVEDHSKEAGIGTISEIFDGDQPHEPRGCISQAWSVAEVLRCYVEDIKGERPEFEGKYGVNR